MNPKSVCVDPSNCKLSKARGIEYMSISKGAAIVSDPQHLGATAPRGVSAVQYITRKHLKLIIATPHAKPTDQTSRDVQFLVALGRGRRLPAAAVRQRANAICKGLGADGWFVPPTARSKECLVLLRPAAVLK